MKSKRQEKVLIQEDIVPSQMSDVLIQAFNRYAKAVITDRAIPDVRDGLKPVQRRIIYDMFDQGDLYSKPTVKCATIVGHVMGHYHPHGDSSIYDALVHLSQGWKMEEPLVDFQGNNGSIDDDPAAANRYTEARLSRLSEFLVKGIEKETVEMVPTFDDKSLEPTVLPARFPNLLVNGTQGIAVGSTTFIPSHNLGEVIDATIYRITHRRANLDDILQFIKGPDFPTGGILDDKEAIRHLYETGKGSLTVYSHVQIDHQENTIVIDEIPTGVVKIDFVANLVKRKETDNLDNIEEVVDESAKDDVRIVIKIKKGASPEDVLNYLQSKGCLKNNLSCNFLAIVKGHPKTLPLLEILDAYIDHQREIETRSAAFDLKTDQRRLEIVAGLVKVYSIVDEVIAKIKKCHGKESVKTMLKDDYGFTENQAEAIAMLPLYRLSNTDIVALREEDAALRQDIERLKGLLSDSEKLDREIVRSLKEVSKLFARPRLTEILSDKLVFDTVDQTKLIAKEDCYVAITEDGYSKRTSPKSYQASCDANKDDPLHLPKMKTGDRIVFCQKCSTHDAILFFTDKGNYGYLPVYLLPELKWKEEGKHLNNLLSLKANEKIIKAFLLNKFLPGINVVILTSENKIKRTALVEFAQTGLTKRTVRACKLLNGSDSVVGVEMTGGNSDIIVCNRMGQVSRFNEADIPLVSLSAMGVKAISSSIENPPLVSLVALSSKEAAPLLVLADRRAARLVSSAKIETTERLGAKTNLVRIFKKNPMNIVSLSKVDKIRGQKNYASATTAEQTTVIDLGDLAPVELNSEIRENIPGLGKAVILGKNEAGTVIDETFPIETPKEVKVSPVKAKADKADTQLSLFDLFEKDKKN